jgi:aspartate/methionine/tyrosine aminotransferase
MFSSRLPPTLVPNALSAAVTRRRLEGPAFVDLTGSNPTVAGFTYPEAVIAALGDPAALTYDPQPFGLPAARRAVAEDFSRRGIRVDATRIVLTASSSESYSFLFKVLCDPGDSVLVPVPSYPLFEHLAGLDAVTIRTYPLEFHGRWTLDAAAVADALEPRTRAILVVSPNNPTGSRLRRDELGALERLCADRDVVLVGDEVFADYGLVDLPDAAISVLEAARCLVVSLGGLSKSAGLPQLKLGWMAFGGPDPLVAAALDRLELVADTYLSVSAAVQVAAPRLLELGAAIRRQIADRVLLNYESLRRHAAGFPACVVMPAEGGWSAVVQAPAVEDDERTALRLLDGGNVLVHPGYFFDFPRDGYLVVSLLVEPHAFAEGIRRMFMTLDSAPASRR